MVVENVQDYIAESWDEMVKKREEIIKRSLEMKEMLVQLHLSKIQQKEKVQPQHIAP